MSIGAAGTADGKDPLNARHATDPAPMKHLVEALCGQLGDRIPLMPAGDALAWARTSLERRTCTLLPQDRRRR